MLLKEVEYPLFWTVIFTQAFYSERLFWTDRTSPFRIKACAFILKGLREDQSRIKACAFQNKGTGL